MEIVLALAIGIVFGSGIWLLLRPRTFQVLIGLMLMSYAVNLFIFSMGRLSVDRAAGDAGRHRAADPARWPTRCRRRWC
jgi:multisubunit Na+/H+ antiporter MnhC subunit